jgi:hypothetical protein
MALIGVVVLVVMLLLIGKVEGLTAKCRTSLRDFDEEKGAYPGEDPPLDANECAGEKVARKKQCWEAKGGKWETSDATGCKSWTKVVSWNNKNIKEKSGKRPWAKVKDWTRKTNKNFNGAGDLWDNTSDYKTTAKCAQKCSETDDCKGFVFRKTDKLCWGVKQDRVDAGLKGENGMYSFVVKGTTVSSGGASSGTSKTFVEMTGGNYNMSAKSGNTGDYAYVIFSNSCTKSSGQMKLSKTMNVANDPAWGRGRVKGTNDDTSVWKFTSQGGGKWKIENLAHSSKGCKSSTQLGSIYETKRTPKNTTQRVGKPEYNEIVVKGCDTYKNDVMFTNWGDWYLEPEGNGYKIRLANCGTDAPGAYIHVDYSGATLRKKNEATVVYFEKV